MSQATESPDLMTSTEEPHYEIVDGQKVELPPMGAREVWLASRLFYQLGAFVVPLGIGQVVSEMLFHLRDGSPQRRPDLAYVSAERWPIDREVPTENAWELVPDLAIEVISPSDRAIEIARKVREYFQAGCRRVWVVWPDERLVHDYESPTQIHVLTRDETLDGGEVLPGLRLPISEFLPGQDASGQ